MIKIAFLTSEYPNPKITASGGIGTSIMNLAEGLIQQGHQILVLVYGQNSDEVFIENGIIFYKIKNIKLKGLSRYLSQKKVEKLINELVSNNEIDIVEAPDWIGFTSFIKPKCPLIIRLHGSDTYFCHLDNRPVKWSNHFHEKKALQQADGILSVSQFTGQLTNKLFELNKDFTVVPNGVDLTNFNSSEMEQDSQTILYFGTLIRKKGLLELPFIFNEVFSQNKNVKLILVGKDASDIVSGNKSTWQMMQVLFTTEALQNVNYLGSVPYSDIKQLINQATVCVFPTFAEALPVSWIEAMAMQKAIVASDIGWANEIIENGKDGFLVNPKKHLEFATKVLKLLNDEQLRIQIGGSARKKIEEKFSIKIVAQQSAAFYKKLVEVK
ncbi:MAG: glycosyltransferase family 4 protein [Bacteroidota bacterium]